MSPSGHPIAIELLRTLRHSLFLRLGRGAWQPQYWLAEYRKGGSGVGFIH